VVQCTYQILIPLFHNINNLHTVYEIDYQHLSALSLQCVNDQTLHEVSVMYSQSYVNYVMKDSFPVSRIDNELDALSGAEWFNVLDLQRCYF
jgi:hypothetical protein